ncbi:MAG: insulinase family protein [Sphaerochaetaceae bacterium]
MNVGDTIHGFILQETCPLADYQATGYRFVHILTGMEVCFVENKDTEQFFSYVFRTIPYDDSGVAHILEHSTLSGSQLYAVHDPFMTLEKGSTNTYMNAMTYPDKTVYLAASPLAKDFDNLFSVYSDAVFHPLLRKETFLQEGVRLIKDKEGAHFEGVVFNEMLGAWSDHDDILSRNSIRALFPNSCYQHDAGGDPCAIIGLDYERYLTFYKEHYHPSNCKLLVYGDNDMGSILSRLDKGYLCNLTRQKEVPAESPSYAWKQDHSVVFSSPAEEKSKKDGGSIVLAWATTFSKDNLEVVTLSVLVDLLLGDSSRPLYKALLDSGLGEDISPESGMVADYPQMPFMVGFKGIEKGKGEAVESLILSTLQSIVAKGIDKQAIAGCLKRERFKQQEISGSIPQGLRVMDRSLHGWMAGCGPFATMQVSSALDALDACLVSDPLYFEHWMEKHLLENHHRVLVSVIPDVSYLRNQRETIAQRALKALGEHPFLSQENEEFLRFENTPDTFEHLQGIPHLTIGDLPCEIKEDLYEMDTIAKCPVYIKTLFTNSVVYTNIALDLADFSTEELLLLPLYARVLQMTGIGKMDFSQVSIKLKQLTGGLGMNIDNGSDFIDGRSQAIFLIQLKTLPSDTSEAYSFLSMFFQEANVTDEKQIKAALVDIKGDYADNVMYSASNFACQAATSCFNASLMESELLGGLSQWLFLSRIGDERIPQLAKDFKAIGHKLFQRSRMRVQLCCESGFVNEGKDKLALFLQSFPLGVDVVRVDRNHDFLIQKGEQSMHAFLLPSNVSYCCYALHSDHSSTLNEVAQTLFGQILSTNDLWTSVRLKGGAYGVDSRTEVQENLFVFSTYRDPRIGGSFLDFVNMLEKYAKEKVPKKEIENAQIIYIGSELKPLSPKAEALRSLRRILFHYTDAQRRIRRQQMLQVDEEVIQIAVRSLLEKAQEGQSRVVLCSSSMLKKEQALFPFLSCQGQDLPL